MTRVLVRQRAAAVSAAVLLGALGMAPATAGDAAVGRKRAVACHGIDGVSKMLDAPNLSGQVEGYLGKALTDFRSGARSNETMSLAAKDLSGADIANLAAHSARIPVDVTPPE